MKIPILLLALCTALSARIAAADVVDDLLKSYQAAGAKDFSVGIGDHSWQQSHPDPEAAGKSRSCATCHGEDLRAKGKHVQSGKVINAMSPAVNRGTFDRYQVHREMVYAQKQMDNGPGMHAAGKS